MLCFARKMAIEIGVFYALHTYGRQLNQHPYIHFSITHGGLYVKKGVWKNGFLKKKAVERIWRMAVIRVLRKNYSQINPINLPGFDHIYNYRTWCRYLEAQYKRHWKVHFAKKT
ncbi:MAG: transposase [Candidatus Phlomobacter fragariae]